MTGTALKNREIKSRERIANKDRELKEKEFKHKQIMDVVGAGANVAKLFIPGMKGASLVTSALKANDPSFYKAYIQDLDKFTNLTTWLRLGYENYDGVLNAIDRRNTSNFSRVSMVSINTPGIAVIHWTPTIGSGSDDKQTLSMTPMNQILQRTKEQVLKSNSRSNVPYEAADLGLNFLATGSIITAIAEFERLTLVAQTYKADNQYYNSDAITALDAVADDWINNLPDARKYLLLLKKRFNSAIVAPSGLNYYKKLLYLATMWVKDSEANPAQIYTAVTDAFWKLNEDGSALIAQSPERDSPETFYNQISSLIQAIAENPDYVDMYADLRSAFGSNIFQLEESFNEDASIVENYDAYAIEQIANICTLPVTYAADDAQIMRPLLDSINVYQSDTGFLYQGEENLFNEQGPRFRAFDEDFGEPALYTYAKYLSDSVPHVLNFHKDNITGDDVLDASRWHFIVAAQRSLVDEGQTEFRIGSCDVAVCSCITIHSRNSLGTHIWNQVGSYMLMPRDIAAYVSMDEHLAAASTFDWMPLNTVIYNDVPSTGLDRYFIRTYGEVQHAIKFPIANIKNMNNVCVLSEMYIDTSEFKMSGK